MIRRRTCRKGLTVKVIRHLVIDDFRRTYKGFGRELMRLFVVLSLVFVSGITALAQQGKPVSYASGNETVNGVLYLPPGKGPFPGIVVIHEWWGLNDWVKDQAAKLADHGYAALAVDLYRGKSTSDPQEAHELSRGLPADRATRDLLAAVKFLKSQKRVAPDRIGVIGWCMGGGYALDLAIAEPSLQAAVVNYGHLATDPARLKQIHAAVLGVFGGQDRGIPPSDVHAFEHQMKEMGKSVDVTVYPDAGHAFQNPNNKQGYRAQDTADAWKRILAFLSANLKRGSNANHLGDDDDPPSVPIALAE